MSLNEPNARTYIASRVATPIDLLPSTTDTAILAIPSPIDASSYATHSNAYFQDVFNYNYYCNEQQSHCIALPANNQQLQDLANTTTSGSRCYESAIFTGATHDKQRIQLINDSLVSYNSTLECNNTCQQSQQHFQYFSPLQYQQQFQQQAETYNSDNPLHTVVTATDATTSVNLCNVSKYCVLEVLSKEQQQQQPTISEPTTTAVKVDRASTRKRTNFSQRASTSSGCQSPEASSPEKLNQRVKANRKERRRTQSINLAFSKLRKHIPDVPLDTKLSKIKTLRLAINYINHLVETLNFDGQADILSQSLAQQTSINNINTSSERSSIDIRKAENINQFTISTTNTSHNNNTHTSNNDIINNLEAINNQMKTDHQSIPVPVNILEYSANSYIANKATFKAKTTTTTTTIKTEVLQMSCNQSNQERKSCKQISIKTNKGRNDTALLNTKERKHRTGWPEIIWRAASTINNLSINNTTLISSTTTNISSKNSTKVAK